jgi:hypothetical protein
MTTKGIYKRGNIYWIRFTGPDEKIKFETSRSHRNKMWKLYLQKEGMRFRKADILLQSLSGDTLLMNLHIDMIIL